MTAQIRQIPPVAVSNSLKSVCQTRLRFVEDAAADRCPGRAVGAEPNR
jgi:hypothetical protein